MKGIRREPGQGDDGSLRVCMCWRCGRRRARVTAVRGIPPSVLPSSAARTALEALAAAGCDVRVTPGRHAGRAADWTISIFDQEMAPKAWLLCWRGLCDRAGVAFLVAGLMGVDELGIG